MRDHATLDWRDALGGDAAPSERLAVSRRARTLGQQRARSSSPAWWMLDACSAACREEMRAAVRDAATAAGPDGTPAWKLQPSPPAAARSLTYNQGGVKAGRSQPRSGPGSERASPLRSSSSRGLLLGQPEVRAAAPN
jgi:hypothetical protein